VLASSGLRINHTGCRFNSIVSVYCGRSCDIYQKLDDSRDTRALVSLELKVRLAGRLNGFEFPKRCESQPVHSNIHVKLLVDSKSND